MEAGLSDQNFQSLAFDLYLQSPVRETNSLWDFFEDTALDSGLTPAQVRKISNPRSKLVNQVQFYEKNDLESRSSEILSELGYAGGVVSLDDLRAREAKRVGLSVNFHVPRPADSLRPVLGCIQFDPLVIDVYEYDTPNAGRSRFTLAHELAHHLLGHGKYLVRESCDESDFVLQRRAIIDGSDIARMEFQANYFASSLLLPRIHFIEDFRRLAHDLGIVDKGYGHLYVDDQLCNVQNYEIVTGHLMGKYGVSRAPGFDLRS